MTGNQILDSLESAEICLGMWKNLCPLQFLVALTILVSSTTTVASTFTINNTSHAVQKDGVDVFPLTMFETCHHVLDGPAFGATCSQSIGALGNFDYNEAATLGAPYSYWQEVAPVYEANDYWFDAWGRRFDDSELVAYSQNDSFFGFYLDETDVNPTGDPARWANSQANYPRIKAKFPDKLVLATYWGDFTRLGTVADVIQYCAFTHKSTSTLWDIKDYVFAAEFNVHLGMKSGCSSCTSLNSFPNKSIWILWLAVASQWAEGDTLWEPVTPQEMRAEAYWTITIDAKGLGYWAYRVPDWSKNPVEILLQSLSLDPTIAARYNDLAGELQGLESVILLPTINHSWGGVASDMSTVVGVRDPRVTFSPNPTREMTELWGYHFNYFSYSLKQSGNTFYLFVANKSSETVDDVVVSIDGLAGPMTARVLGASTLGYDAAGRTVPVSNGVFTDNFQGFAGRVYEIKPNDSGDAGDAGDGDASVADAEDGDSGKGDTDGTNADGRSRIEGETGCGCSGAGPRSSFAPLLLSSLAALAALRAKLRRSWKRQPTSEPRFRKGPRCHQGLQKNLRTWTVPYPRHRVFPRHHSCSNQG